MPRGDLGREHRAVADALPFDAAEFLATPLLCASVATVDRARRPALGVLWYLAQGGRFWFTTRRGATALVRAAERGNEVAVLVEKFDPNDQIRMVRATGRARTESWDSRLVSRMYERYLGSDHDQWPPGWGDRLYNGAYGTFDLWSVEGTRGVMQTFDGLVHDAAYRWNTPEGCPDF